MSLTEQLPAAVLWDMDGTIVDTEPYWIQAEFEVVEAHGGSWSLEHAHTIVGSDLLAAATYIRTHGGIDVDPPVIVELLLERVIAAVKRELPWRPGARELLQEFGALGVPSILVTMSYRRLAEAVVDQLPAGTFTALVTGDEVEHGKPHPAPYLRAAELAGAAPADCIAIEDSPTGVASAAAAGCATIAVPHVAEIQPGAGYVIVETLAGVGASELLALARG